MAYNIKKMMKKSLSNDDISEILDHKTKILTYPELSQYKTLDELLSPHGNVIILYLTGENYGHWTCLFKLDKNNVEFFDPYAMKPDRELKLIPMHFRKIKKQIYPHLSHLLNNSKYIIHYNDYQLQKYVKDINTCGRHCVVRLLFKNMEIDDYIKIMTDQNINPDQIVTYLTSFL